MQAHMVSAPPPHPNMNGSHIFMYIYTWKLAHYILYIVLTEDSQTQVVKAFGRLEAYSHIHVHASKIHMYMYMSVIH